MDQNNLSDVFKSANQRIMQEIHCALPAIIVKYNHKTQTASVKINIKRKIENGDHPYPIIPNVPVVFPASGGAFLTMPINKGDGCLLLFADIDIKNWLLGANDAIPQMQRMHNISDAIAIMGLHTIKTSLKTENNTDVLLSYADSKVRLKKGGIVQIENAKEVNIKTKDVIINCEKANIKASGDIMAECKNAILKAEENINITSVSANVTTTETAKIECKNATIKATENIETESVLFTQKGNMKIEGDVEITGTGLITQKLTTQNGIENSGANLVSNGKTFETHTHSYQEGQNVTTPEGVYPVNKLPNNTGATQ